MRRSRTPSRGAGPPGSPASRHPVPGTSIPCSGATARSKALKRVLLREVRCSPCCWSVEDLHWIDTETQAVLDSLVESLPTARLLLLVTYRPEYQHGWGSKTSYAQLRLDPLPDATRRRVLPGPPGGRPEPGAPDAALDCPHAGQSLFLEESVRTLVETGVLGGSRGPIVWPNRSTTLQVPATVQARAGGAHRPAAAGGQRLLQTAAVIGTEVPWPLLQAIADMPDEALCRGLAHLQAAEFFYETRPVSRARLHLQACPHP